VPTLNEDAVRWLRWRSQRLVPAGEGRGDVVAATVRALGAVQAQYADAAALSIRARTAGAGGPTAADVELARVRPRSIVRTWCHRGTLQLVASEELDSLLALLGPGLVRAGRGRRRQLGLDEATSARALRALRDCLASRGPSTRDEIVEQLIGRGVELRGQARPHLLGLAALEGLICLGPDRDGEPTYVLLEDWLAARSRRDAPRSREAGLAELARRYLDGHAPAGPEDLAAWSGLSLGDARAGWREIADELVEVEAAGRPAFVPRRRRGWLDERPPRGALVRLVPGYDPYLLDYRGRDLAVPPAHARKVWPGGGLLHPTVLVDGLAVGTWRSRRRRGGVEVEVTPFGRIEDEARAGVEGEVADLGRFLEVAAEVRWGSA
jgi:hypothetical protein